MKSRIEQTVYSFLKKRLDLKETPLLLGLSGGPDSLTLFYILLKLKKKLSFNLHIAHVDHKWRPKSSMEAQELNLLAKKHAIPFHLRTLDSKQWKSNKEALAREERLNFFLSLHRLLQCQALLLGHHADDQAETVLKRTFEGASLAKLFGLRKESAIRDMPIWRPLLSATKSDICSWLSAHKHNAFDDYTNKDPNYLRGRMRVDLLPRLSRSFGKEIQRSLCRIASESEELQSYLDKRVEPYLKSLQMGKMGVYLDFKDLLPLDKVEMKHLISKICAFADLSPGRDILDLLYCLLVKKTADKKVEKEKKTIFVDRGRLFVPFFKPLNKKEPLEIDIGVYSYENWKISIKRANKEEKNPRSWKNLWVNYSSVFLPYGKYYIAPPITNSPYPRTSPLNQWWSKNKVPAFLWKNVPVIWSKKEIKHEFLTGKKKGEIKDPFFYVEIGLEKRR